MASDGLPGRGGRGRRGRRVLALVLLVGVCVTVVAAAPRLHEVGRTLADVQWEWAVAAVLANVASLLVRGLGWRALLAGALAGRDRGSATAERAYLVGQLVNAVLPGRLGEASKIALYTGHLDDPAADWAVVTGTVAAHRLLDTVPLAVLILFLAVSIGVPGWTVVVLALSAVLLVGALLIASRAAPARSEGRLGHVIAALRGGLGVLRTPRAAAVSLAFQSTGWLIEVAGVWLAFRAFGIEENAAAGLVVVATNAATLVPFLPSNVGVFQVAVAGVLSPAGVPYSAGLGFGIGLQAIETLATATAGLPAAIREGLSLGTLSQLPRAALEELAEFEQRPG